LAAGATETIALPADNTIVGTLQYMSPEQLEGKKQTRAATFCFRRCFTSC
jgi:serine/threonine protein kinase